MLIEFVLPLSPNAMYCSGSKQPHSLNVADGLAAVVFSDHVSCNWLLSGTQFGTVEPPPLSGVVVLVVLVLVLVVLVVLVLVLLVMQGNCIEAGNWSGWLKKALAS